MFKLNVGTVGLVETRVFFFFFFFFFLGGGGGANGCIQIGEIVILSRLG